MVIASFTQIAAWFPLVFTMLASTSVVDGEDELAGLTEEGVEETARYALFHWIYPLLT